MDEEQRASSQNESGQSGADADPLDLGDALRRISALLDDIGQSGNDLNELTVPGLDDNAFEELYARAQQREKRNESVFSGESELFATLHGVEDASILAEAHKLVLLYWRRAKTSGRIAEGLQEAYRAEGQQGPSADCTQHKRKLQELLSVVSALADEHAQLVELAQDAQKGDRESAQRRYDERIAGLPEHFDELKATWEQTNRMHIRTRRGIMSEMAGCLDSIETVNADFAHYGFIETQTRELPES